MKNKLLISLFILFSLSFNSVMAEKAEEAVLLYNEAIDTYNANEVDKSIELFNKAIELDPDFYDANYNLAQILMSVGKLQEAIKPLEAILKIKPDDPETLYNLGKNPI